MYISVASAVLEKYQWFKFTGTRRRSFKKHHKSHQAVLERKDVFGLLKQGNAYKMVDITAPKIIFSLSLKEVKALLKDAKSFSPIVNGKRLPKGDIKALKIRVVKPKKAEIESPPKRVRTRRRRVDDNEEPEERIKIPKEDVDASIYPALSMPPKKADVQRLYNLFNKKYFDNNCPKHINIQFSTALRFMGRARVRITPPNIPVYTLSLAKTGFTTNKRVIDILLHEMIHLDHYKKAYEDNDSVYLNAGHGPLFLRDMARLNSFGYEIRVQDDGKSPVVELSEKVYLLRIETRRGDLLFYSHVPFKRNLKHLISTLRSKIFNPDDFVSYMYGETKCSNAYLVNKLTDKGELPLRRHVRLPRSQEIADTLIETTKVLETGDLKLKTSGDLRDIIVKSVSAFYVHKHIDFESYLVSIVAHATGKKFLTPREHSAPFGAAREMITEDEYDYIRKSWVDVVPADFYKGSVKKQVEEAILQLDLDGEAAVEMIMSVYSYSFKDRVDAETAGEIVVHLFGKLITDTTPEIMAWVKKHLAPNKFYTINKGN